MFLHGENGVRDPARALNGSMYTKPCTTQGCVGKQCKFFSHAFEEARSARVRGLLRNSKFCRDALRTLGVHQLRGRARRELPHMSPPV